MTLQGVHEIGLADWPGWYRRANAACFVSDDAPTGRGRRGGVSEPEREHIRLSEWDERVERERERLREVGRERLVGAMREEEIGEGVLRRLRGLEYKNRGRDSVRSVPMDRVKGRGQVKALVGVRGIDDSVAKREIGRWADDVDSDVESDRIEGQKVGENMESRAGKVDEEELIVV
jgi:hypothetical protein